MMPTDRRSSSWFIGQRRAAAAAGRQSSRSAASAAPRRQCRLTAPPPQAVSPAEEQARAIADSLLALPKNQRLAALENMPPEQLVNFPNLCAATSATV